MKCYYKLYLSDDLIDDKDDIIKKITKDEFKFAKFFITLTGNKKNHLEIYNSLLLVQKKLVRGNELVVGVASDYFDALKLVEKISQEVYDETKSLDIRNYILQTQQMYEEDNV